MTKYDHDWIWPNMTKHDWMWLNVTIYNRIWLNVTEYDWIRPNMTEYDWILQNMTEYVWIWQLYMSEYYSYICLNMTVIYIESNMFSVNVDYSEISNIDW